MTLFGDGGFAAARFAGLALSRIEASKSHQLTGIVEGANVGNLSQQLASGEITDTGNRSQEFFLVAQIRMLVEMILDVVFNLVNLLVEQGDMAQQLFAYQRGTDTAAE